MPLANAPPIPPSLQALTPVQARFCLATARFLKQDLDLDITGKSLLIAFSGGADSLALLLVLYYLAPSLRLLLTAAHLDHGLRPSSAPEAERCRSFCRRLGIACLNERRDIVGQCRQNGTGVEEEGRAARYAFFARAAADAGCNWIVTGHQNDDLAEDVLMRLIRGAGWPAVSGMPAVDQKRRLLRPLLLTPRKEIENFLASLGLNWLRDGSNEDRAYLRNRMRLDIMPLIRRENPSFPATVAGLWKLGRIDAEYFDGLVPSPPSHDDAVSCTPVKSGSAAPAIHMRREQLESLPRALRLRWYKSTLSRLGPGQPLLSTLLALDRAWLAGGKRTIHSFPGGKTAMVDAGSIVWHKH